eukprot:TRINITY_DN10604_c0_g1_i1.p1 TRINITY_DN10604_c0_g1~~TRINITY_DN10604_c0_g1_i1.p1  ORF type:complete len:474 (+),score=43.36 TRINITY_DN10604_c0_g1_i1:411-1832(+)
MQDLPLELLVNGIWSHLSPFDIFRRARYVCKLWNANIERSIMSVDLENIQDLPGPMTICQTQKWQKSTFLSKLRPEQLTGTLKVSTASYHGSEHFAEELLSYFCNITTLDIFIAFAENGLWGSNHAIVRLPHLKKFRLSCVSWPLSDSATEILAPKLDTISMEYEKEPLLLQFASKMTNLRHLHVAATCMPEYSSVIKVLTRLESLVIPQLGVPDDDDFVIPPIILPPKLVKLEIQCDDLGVLPDLSPCASTLTSLIARKIKQTPHKLPADLQLSSLTLASCFDGFLDYLSPALKNLHSYCNEGRTKHLQIPTNQKSVSGVSKLQLWNLQNYDTIDISHFPHLTSFYAYTYNGPTTPMPQVMAPTVALTSLLRSIEIYLCVTSKFIIDLKGLPLEKLFLHEIDNAISDEAWAIIMSFQHLSHLELRGGNAEAISRSAQHVTALCDALPACAFSCSIISSPIRIAKLRWSSADG